MKDQGPISSTMLQKVLSLVPQIFLFLAAFECNTTSDWLKHTVKPIRSRYIQTFKILEKKTKNVLGEYEPSVHECAG